MSIMGGHARARSWTSASIEVSLGVAAVAAALVAGSIAAPMANAAPAGVRADLTDCLVEAGVDLVVGLPSYDVGGVVNAGAVVVLRDVGGASTLRQPTSRQVLTASFFGAPVQASARVGSAVVTQDIDADGCLEIVAGAPGTEDSRGAILISGGARLTSADLGRPRQVGARFGAALRGLEPMWGGLELLVGEPGATVDGAAGAGRAYGVSKLGDPALRAAQVYEQGHGDVSGASEVGDHFGAVLTGGYSDAYAQVDTAYLLIGVPDEDIGSQVDAGRVVLIGENGGSTLSQDSPGVPGAAEDRDHFGASVALDGYEGVLWFGAPDEDLGTRFEDAGMILEAVVGADGLMRPGATARTQDSPGVGGAVEADDRFGASLWWHQAGAPGDSAGSLREAGALSAFVGGGGRFAQGSGAPGIPEAFDHFGAKMSGFAFYDDGAGTSGAALVLTVPGENVGAVADAGLLALQGWLGDSSGPRAQAFIQMQTLAKPQPGAGTGMNVASTADRGWNAPTG